MYVNKMEKLGEKNRNWKIIAINRISMTISFIFLLDYLFYWVEMTARNLSPLLLKDTYKPFPRMNQKIIFTLAVL